MIRVIDSETDKLMKSLLLVLSTCILLGSCCTKEACTQMISNIKLSGFTLEETDTIYIIYIGHVADTQFAKGVNVTTDAGEMILSETPNEYSSTAIVIPGADRAYSLMDPVYETKKSECNKCFLRKRTEYEVFKGCKVNGVYQEEGFTLTK
jgi:ABC-type oligopeptide transport system substrate-binding subunit